MVVMAMVVFVLGGVTHNDYADDFECRGVIDAVTKDNIVVPDGATCRLTGAIVQGNIIVLTNAVLVADGADVEGNIQSEGARWAEYRWRQSRAVRRIVNPISPS